MAGDRRSSRYGDGFWAGVITMTTTRQINQLADQICVCGDPRRDHKGGDGPCSFNKPEGLGHHGAPNCDEFRADPFLDESKRGTIFHDHTCYRCRDGELPCKHKGHERDCDTLRARND